MKSKLYELLVKSVKEYNENSYYAAMQAEELHDVTSFEISKDRMKIYCDYAVELAEMLGIKLICEIKSQRLYDVDRQYTIIIIEE